MGNIANMTDIQTAASRLKSEYGVDVDTVASQTLSDQPPAWVRVEIRKSAGPIELCGRVTVGSNSRHLHISTNGTDWHSHDQLLRGSGGAPLATLVASPLDGPIKSMTDMARLVDTMAGSLSLISRMARSLRGASK